MNNAELNELLSITKQAQKELYEWPYGSMDKPIPTGTRKCWDSLRLAMRSDLPLSIRLETGGVRQIGTIGGLTENLWLFYSEIRYAGCCMEAVDLRMVTSIEKVEDGN